MRDLLEVWNESSWLARVVLVIALVLAGFALGSWALELVTPHPAAAATRYITVAGAGTHSGTTLGNAMTLAEGNAAAAAGDSLQLADGSYPSPIHPVRNGTSGSRIVYAGNASNPAAVIVTAINIGPPSYLNVNYGDFVSVRNVSSSGALTLGYRQQPSAPTLVTNAVVTNVTAVGTLSLHSRYSILDNITITGTGTIDMNSQNLSSTWAIYNTVRNSSITLSYAGATPVNFLWLRDGYYNTFQNCAISFTSSATGSNYNIFGELYESQFNRFLGNTWTIVNNSTTSGTEGVLGHRDYSSFNQWIGNTVTVTGSKATQVLASNSGSFPSTVRRNRWDSNSFKFSNALSSGMFYYQNGVAGDTLQFNTFDNGSGGKAFVVSSSRCDSMINRHNTYFGSGSTVVYVDTSSSGTGSRMVSNIFYGTSANTNSAPTLVLPTSAVAIDSVGLLFNRGGLAAAAIYKKGTAPKAPAGAAGFGIATKAVWNTPRFTDSTYASLNTTLLAASPADDDNLHDGFAGAIGFATSDATAPEETTDLLSEGTTHNSFDIYWSEAGDDSASGTATEFDVRYSTSPIDEGNWASATQASGEPTPTGAGNFAVFTITGLASSTTYYVALKTRDEAGNWSIISNVVTDATTAPPGVNAITVSELQVYANYTTAGAQVPFTGDSDRDATVRLYIGTADSCVYADTCGGVSSFCGSIFDLTPGTTYTLHAEVIDPDGGSATLNQSFTTKSYPVYSPSGHVYVDPVLGSDGNPGTAVLPKRSIQAGWNAAAPGYAVHLENGIYYDTLLVTTANDGAAGSRKWLVSSGGAIVDGSDVAFLTKSTYDSLTISGKKVYFIRGFTYWPRQVTFNNASDLPRHQTLKSLVNDSMGVAAGYGWFRSNTGDTMYVQLPGGASPNGATMNYARRTFLIYSTGSWFGVSGITFRNAGCDFNTNDASNVGIRSGVVQLLGANDVVIDGCTFYSNGWDHVSVDSLLGTPTRDVLINGNTMYSQGVAGWGSGTASIANNSVMHHPQIFVDASRGVVIRNNTIRDFYDGGVRVASTSPGFIRDMDVIGNTFTNWTSDAIELDAINGPNVRVIGNVLHQGYVGFDLEVWGGPLYFIRNRASRIEYADIQFRGATASDSLRFSGRQFWLHNTLLSDQWCLRSVSATTRGLWFENNILGSAGRTIYDANNAFYDYPANRFNWNLHVSGSQLITFKTTTYNLSDSATVRTARTIEKNGRFGAVAGFTFRDSAGGDFAPSHLNAINRGRRLPGVNTGTGGYLGTAPEMGAIEYDEIRPAANVLSLLSLASRQVGVAWTDSGDDSLTGPAATIDIRYSSAGTITLANWASATQASGEPAPATPGSYQAHTLLGLVPTTTYWIAMRTIDEVGNPSALSNVVSVTTRSAINAALAEGK